MKKEQAQRNDDLPRLDHLHLILLANEQINLQENVGEIRMPLIDPIGFHKTIQQTIGMKGNNNENWPIQDLYHFSKNF